RAPHEGESAKDDTNPLFTGEELYQQQKLYVYVNSNDMDMDNKVGSNKAGGSGANTGKRVKFKLDNEAQEEDDKKRKKPKPSEKPPISQMTMPYSIISDLMYTKAGITFGQLMSMPPYKNEVKKAITPRRKRAPKDKKGKEKPEEEVYLGESSYRNTPMICKGQVKGWTVDIILDSGSSTSIISRKFLEYLELQVTRSSERMITGIHGNKKSSLGIVEDIPVHLGDVVISINMEVIDTQAYSIVLGTDWLRKARAVIDYYECKVTVKDEKCEFIITCCNTTLPALPKEDDSDDDDNDTDDSDEEDEDEANLGLVETE